MTGGRTVDPAPPRVVGPARTAAERFLQALEARGSSPNTIRSYRSSLDTYLDWIAANGYDWRAPSRAELRGYLAALGEGHGKRTDYRWTNGGLDLLVDLTRKYDLSPDAKGTRFGGRFWAEMLLGESSGLTARVEVGRYPAYSGWLLVASVGGSLHL